MPGDFDESKHPRANDGKFGEGGGGAEASKTDKAKRAKDLVDWARKIKAEKTPKATSPKAPDSKAAANEPPVKPKSGHGSDEDRAKRIDILRAYNGESTDEDIAKEHAAIDNEERVLSAGHIDEPPHEKFGDYEKLTEESTAKMHAIADDLDEARKAVSKESAALESLSIQDPDGDDDDDHNIGSEIDFDEFGEDSTKSIIGDIRKTDADTEDHSDSSADDLEKVEEPEEPEEGSFVVDDDDVHGKAAFKDAVDEYKAQLAAHKEYKVALADRRTRFQEQAEKTHAALEKLVAVQRAALDSAKDMGKKMTKAYRAADKENEHFGDSSIADGISEQEAAAAEQAIGSIYSHRYRQINQMETPVNTDDLVPALRDAARETTSRLKGIAKYLGKKKKIEDVADEDDGEE